MDHILENLVEARNQCEYILDAYVQCMIKYSNMITADMDDNTFKIYSGLIEAAQMKEAEQRRKLKLLDMEVERIKDEEADMMLKNIFDSQKSSSTDEMQLTESDKYTLKRQRDDEPQQPVWKRPSDDAKVYRNFSYKHLEEIKSGGKIIARYNPCYESDARFFRWNSIKHTIIRTVSEHIQDYVMSYFETNFNSSELFRLFKRYRQVVVKINVDESYLYVYEFDGKEYIIFINIIENFLKDSLYLNNARKSWYRYFSDRGYSLRINYERKPYVNLVITHT